MTYMPNITFSCQTILENAEFLEFGLENANLNTGCVHDCHALMRVIPHFNLVLVTCMQRVYVVYLLLAWLRH